MMDFIKEAKNSLSNMNKLSKLLLKYGILIVLLIYITALVIYIWGFYSGNSYEMSELCGRFLSWGNKTFALSVIPALLIDILLKAKDIP